MDKIKIGDYIIIQRQKYTKLHKFGSEESTVMLGKDEIELKNILSNEYHATFKMIPKYTIGNAATSNKRNQQKKRLNFLEPCSSSDINDIKEALQITESGLDNRNIIDDGESQNLKFDDIAKLREICTSSADIVGQIIENSKTFSSKTEYAQEKYLKKKEKKYFEYVQIKRPTIRLIADVMYRQDPDRISGLRIDSLSQIINYSGVCNTGNHLLYESGTNGLLPSALLNSIGENTNGKLIHMHPGNVPQKLGILAMNYSEEQLIRCISVNIYSVLRHYYQSKDHLNETNNDMVSSKDDSEVEVNVTEGNKRKLEQNSSSDDNDVKRVKLTDDSDSSVVEILSSKSTQQHITLNDSQKQKWMIENEMACSILREKMDSLIIVSKESPSTLIKELIRFVKPSRPVVIFNTSREILMELYMEMKSSGHVTNLRITSNFMRFYQILPNRTHPLVNMNGSSGFLLCGYTIR